MMEKHMPFFSPLGISKWALTTATHRINSLRIPAHYRAGMEAWQTYQKYMTGTADYTGIPTHECICGCNVFKIVAWFEDYEMVGHSLTGYCYGCGAKLTVPCEVDRPDLESMVTV